MLRDNFCEDVVKISNPIVEEYAAERLHLVASKSTIPGAGIGLYTLSQIEPGKNLGEYTGQSVTFQESKSIRDRSYLKAVTLFKHIDASKDGSIFKYINDTINEGAHNVRFQSLNGKVFVVSIRSIHPGEELFVKYGCGHWLFVGHEQFLKLQTNQELRTVSVLHGRKKGEIICALESPAMMDIHNISKCVKFSVPLSNKEEPPEVNCHLIKSPFVNNTTMVVCARNVEPGEQVLIHSRYRLQVLPSHIHGAGMGAFARVRLDKQTFLGKYSGKPTSVDEYLEKRKNYPGIDSYVVRNHLQDGQAFYLDPTNEKGLITPLFTSLVCFVNETTNPTSANCCFTHEPGEEFLSLYSTRDIAIGEELLAVYPSEFIRRYPYNILMSVA